MPRFLDSLNLINGQVYDPRLTKMSRQNIALHQGMIIGLGMLPDDSDDEFEVVDIEGKIVLPYVIDLRRELPDRFFVPNSLDHCLAVSQESPELMAVVQTEQQATWIRTVKEKKNTSFLAVITPQLLFNASSKDNAIGLLQDGLVDAFISDENTPSDDVFVAASLTAACGVGGLSREALFDLITWRPRQLMSGRQKGIALMEKPSLRVISFEEEPYLNRKLQGWTVIALDHGKLVYRKPPHA
jgi:hypothetical protein